MLVVCGLNQTTPLIYREQISLNSTHLRTIQCELFQYAGVDECMLLSTCNRSEIYAIVEHPQVLIDWWQQRHQHIWTELQPYFYCHQQEQALRHCLNVACGLDSMLIGEPQILGQLKQSFHHGIELGTIQRELMQRFEFIFQMAKKIRTDSGISQLPISVASVAVDCIQKHFPDLTNKKTLLIGSGDTARLAAIHLQEKGCYQFMVTSRHLEHATQLAKQLNGIAFEVTALNDILRQADIVVTATSCPYPFISCNIIEQTMLARQHQPMVLVDLAVPRDIAAEVASIANIYLINIDHLKEIQAQNQAERLKAASIAHQMIHDALLTYHKKHKSQQAQHVICDFRAYMKNLAKQELQRAHQKLDAGQCQHQVLEELSERLIQKLIHYPTIGIQKAAIEDKYDILEFTNYLFNTSEV